jgi:hypothetical protein
VLWVEKDFEIIPFEVNGSDPKYTWEIVGIYRATNEDILVIEGWLSETVFYKFSGAQHYRR